MSVGGDHREMLQATPTFHPDQTAHLASILLDAYRQQDHAAFHAALEAAHATPVSGLTSEERERHELLEGLLEHFPRSSQEAKAPAVYVRLLDHLSRRQCTGVSRLVQ